MNTSPVITQRSSTLQMMDKIGYIPFVGTGVGAVRMAGSVAGLAIAGSAHLLTDRHKEASFLAHRSCQEFVRGLSEVPSMFFLSAHIDIYIRNELEYDKGERPSKSFAHGRYINLSNGNLNGFNKPNPFCEDAKKSGWFDRPVSGTKIAASN